MFKTTHVKMYHVIKYLDNFTMLFVFYLSAFVMSRVYPSDRLVNFAMKHPTTDYLQNFDTTQFLVVKIRR